MNGSPDSANSQDPMGSFDSTATRDAIFGKDAVAAALAGHVAIQRLGDLIIDAKWDRQELTLTVAAETVVAAMESAKAAGFNFMEDVTCVDWYPSEPRFQVTYSLLSHRFKQRIRVVARLSGDNAVIDSITGVWP